MAGAIFAAWGACLTALLARGDPGAAWAPLAALLQTFLHTGLFITAHDAMHGTVCPGRPRLNDVLGRAAALAYALFGFERLRTAHRLHHLAPGTEDDPDYGLGGRTGFWAWYLGFLRRYLAAAQLLGMAAVFNLLEHGLGVPASRLLAFWVAPSLLSTVQLFYFGTYRPHRPARGDDAPHRDAHRARSTALPPLGSLLACYHFGRHWEHHAEPGVPWWRLHRVPGQRPAESP